MALEMKIGTKQPGSWCCGGAGLIRDFVSVEELAAGVSTGEAALRFPRTEWQVLKTSVWKTPTRPLSFLCLKAFHNEKWPSMKLVNKTLPPVLKHSWEVFTLNATVGF